MGSARKIIMQSEKNDFENEFITGLDDIAESKPRINWTEITLSNDRINEIFLQAIREFNISMLYKK